MSMLALIGEGVRLFGSPGPQPPEGEIIDSRGII